MAPKRLLEQPPWLQGVGLFLLTILTRIPFIPPNLGIDDDCYRIVMAARYRQEWGEYSVSRYPGYPVLEGILSKIPDQHPATLVWAIVVLSGLCGVLFFATWRRLFGARAGVATLAFVMAPVFFSESVQFMDHIPALFLVLCSLYGVSRALTSAASRSFAAWTALSGVCFGLAMATRLSVAPFLLPLFLLVWIRPSVGDVQPPLIPRWWLMPLAFAAISLAVAGAFYWKPISYFGTVVLLPFNLDHDEPIRQIFRATVRVWGFAGTLGLLVCLAKGLPKTSGVGIAALAGLAVGYLQYLRFPFDYGYLLPALPFVLVWAGQALKGRSFLVLCAAIAIGPLLSVSKELRIEGTAFSDEAVVHQRDREANQALGVLNRARQEGLPVRMILADLAPEAEYKDRAKVPLTIEHKGRRASREALIKYNMREPEFKEFLQQGTTLWVLDYNVEVANRVSGFDLVKAGAKPIPTSTR